MGLESLREFLAEGGVGLWLILLNTGYYTLYEKSCILEIEN